MFRGREVTHPEFGRRQLEQAVEDLKDIAVVESHISMSGRFMTMVMGPTKKA
jgi:translation initiation factor IF-3